MKLHYKAQKADGTFYEGTREAADKFALSRELRAETETLISASEAKVSSRAFLDLRKLLPVFKRVPLHEKIIFTRNLAGMLSAGLTVSRALGVLERQTRSQKFKEIIGGLSKRISTGENLSQALSGDSAVFPTLLVSMVKAGEESGNLSNSLFSVSEQLDRSYALQRKVKGALMYPATVIAVLIIVGVVLFVKVVPQLTSAFTDFNVDLPLSTRIVVAVSDFLQAHYITGFLLVLGFIASRLAIVKSAPGKRFFDRALLHMPIITPIIKQANAARVSGTLSSLLSAGVEVVSALEITADVLANGEYRKVLLKAREAIQRGEPMSEVFRAHEDIFPPFLSEMVAVGEETGKLSPMLKETSAFFEAEVEQKTKNISTIIEPVLMVVVGVVVGFFAVAMISPAYSLMNAI